MFEDMFMQLDTMKRGVIRLSQLWRLFDTTDLVMDPRIEVPHSFRLWRQRNKDQFVRYVRAELLLRIYRVLIALLPHSVFTLFAETFDSRAKRSRQGAVAAHDGTPSRGGDMLVCFFMFVVQEEGGEDDNKSERSTESQRSQTGSVKMIRTLNSIRTLSDGSRRKNGISGLLPSVVAMSAVKRRARQKWENFSARLHRKRRKTKTFRVAGVEEVAKGSRKRRDNAVKDLQRMELLLSTLDNGAAAVSVSYKEVLKVALSWVVHHSFFVPAQVDPAGGGGVLVLLKWVATLGAKEARCDTGSQGTRAVNPVCEQAAKGSD